MKKIKFNDNWRVSVAGNEDKTVTLPYDAMLYEMRSADNPNGAAGGYYPGGKYTYRKMFKRPDSKRVILEFEGVYGLCNVYVNGNLLAQNAYGYNNFFVDASSVLKDSNELAVEVDNSKVVNSRWYSGSGIYRDVWLYEGNDICIKPDGLRVNVKELEKALAKIEITFPFNGVKGGEKLGLQITISDCKNRVVHHSVTPYTVFDGDEQKARIVAFIKKPMLWSCDKPNLYSCNVSILNNESVADSDSAVFGIREIRTDPVNGFRLNGKPTLLRGACIHHDNGMIGACEYYTASYRRIKTLKDAGFNAIRTSHQPCSKPMLNACDKLGMLVLEETFDMWGEAKNKEDFSRYFEAEWKNVIYNMVAKDFNHPCVIMYCIGNEIPEVVKLEGIRLSRAISDYLRSLDGTRPLTNAIQGLCVTKGNTLPILLDLGLVTKEQVAAITGTPNSDNASLFNILLSAVANGSVNDAMTQLAENLGRVVEHKSVGERLEEPTSHLDVSGYNYMKSRYEIDRRDYPDKVLLGTETVPPDIDILWEKCKTIPQLIGDFTWTGWDYIGEAGIGHTNYEGKSNFTVKYPGYLAYCGDIDITGYRRPISYLREIVFGFRNEPYVSVQNPKYFGKDAKTTAWAEPETIESWTFAGQENNPVRVKVYADAEEVILYINGKEVGRKVPKRMRVEFDTIYRPGEVKAVAVKNGTEYCHSITTAGEPQLKAILDKNEISSGDICYLECELRDKNDILNMDVSETLAIDCSDNLELLGFGTGNPCATEPFFASSHVTFNGRAVAVFRAKAVGNGLVTISCDGKTIDKVIKIK